MANLQRISEEIQAGKRRQRQIGGNVDAALGSGGGGRVLGGGISGGNIGSSSGVSATAATRAMRNAGAGPAPDDNRIARHQPTAKGGPTGNDYPQNWLSSGEKGRIDAARREDD